MHMLKAIPIWQLYFDPILVFSAIQLLLFYQNGKVE